MEDMTVLCIGGASGMGRGIAEAAVQAGGRVIVTSRTKVKAEQAAEEIGARGYAVDITNPESVSDLYRKVGAIDHLAITAGATGRTDFRTTPTDEARQFMDTKLWATHRCIFEARQVLSQSGSITLITGGYATSVTADAGHVHVAFQATEALVRAAAVALAPIRCNALRPGFIDSALWDFLEPQERDDLRKKEIAKTLTGKIVSPLELGRVAVALMNSGVVTGAVVPVDGGRHLYAGD